ARLIRPSKLNRYQVQFITISRRRDVRRSGDWSLLGDLRFEVSSPLRERLTSPFQGEVALLRKEQCGWGSGASASAVADPHRCFLETGGHGPPRPPPCKGEERTDFWPINPAAAR